MTQIINHTPEINLSFRVKGDNLIMKLGDVTKEINVTNDLTDEATQIARTILERRKEMLDRRRREMLKEYNK